MRAERSIRAAGERRTARAAEGKVVANFALPKSEGTPFRVSRKIATRLTAGLLRARLGSGFLPHRLKLAVPIPKRLAASLVVKFSCSLMPMTLRRKSVE